MFSNKILYENISELCQERGISIRSLEFQLGFSNGTIQGWKKGYPRFKSILAVCSFFRVSIDSLVGFDPKDGG
jgi:transcriptional regulator with XRE-family HTH domain